MQRKRKELSEEDRLYLQYKAKKAAAAKANKADNPRRRTRNR